MLSLQNAHIQFLKCSLHIKQNTIAGITCTAACFASINSTATIAGITYTTTGFASTNAYHSPSSFAVASRLGARFVEFTVVGYTEFKTKTNFAEFNLSINPTASPIAKSIARFVVSIYALCLFLYS